jgi:hypothetical protein
MFTDPNGDDSDDNAAESDITHESDSEEGGHKCKEKFDGRSHGALNEAPEGSPQCAICSAYWDHLVDFQAKDHNTMYAACRLRNHTIAQDLASRLRLQAEAKWALQTSKMEQTKRDFESQKTKLTAAHEAAKEAARQALKQQHKLDAMQADNERLQQLVDSLQQRVGSLTTELAEVRANTACVASRQDFNIRMADQHPAKCHADVCAAPKMFQLVLVDEHK